MKTHCLKIINGSPDSAQKNSIRKWENELTSKHDKFPYEEDEKKVYFEGTKEECESALKKLDFRAKDLFLNPVSIDYELY
ncbi:MAG: hypothetical protein CL624_04540 [Arcobacter sp.]|nr:hypothetical protein [Arcobacter sp.]|tara:strand:+ start:20216 stop:20455 length:240 start_codon:yes stop_codon:yes gene_type:complete